VSATPDEERAWFEQLFRETRLDLLAYVARRSPSPEEAADALAETYLVAWQKLNAIPPGDQARLWLYGVARKVLLRTAGGRRTRHELVDRLARELRAARPPHTPFESAGQESLRAALASLPERDREILTMTAWEGLMPVEIAAVLGTSANAVRVRLHRARARVRRKLDPERAEAPDVPGASSALS
jgi:RNA polymerase sigma factor (sigma-70 family)